jgi:hypothetical protein
MALPPLELFSLKKRPPEISAAVSRFGRIRDRAEAGWRVWLYAYLFSL